VSTILVTGANGFIGSHLCERLISEGHEVHGVSRILRSSQNGNVQWWQADLCDSTATTALLGNILPQIVFHLASRVTGSRELGEVVPTFQANLASTVHVLVSAVEAGCERVVLAGSCEVPRQIDGPTLCSPYAAAKWSSAGYADMFRALFHVPVVVPRIFMTYGPGQQDTQKIVPYTVLSMLRGERPKLGSGRRMVDWIYIDDVIQGLTRAAFAAEMEQSTFDLGSGSLVSIRGVVEQIAEIIDNGVEADFGAVPDRPLEHERVADTTFLERAFCWKPATSLREGLRKTVSWFKSSRDIAA
jgi:nucleoside-diphosphate-sugar epimerase